jgi:hypothetical protein
VDGSFRDAEAVLRVVPAVSAFREGWPFLALHDTFAASQVLMARSLCVSEEVSVCLVLLRGRGGHGC